MAHAVEESAEMVSIASALVLNIGTLTPQLIESMISAGKAANQKGIPIVLDAVGAGAVCQTLAQRARARQPGDEQAAPRRA